MSTLLVPWLLEESKSFLLGPPLRHRKEPKIILLLKFISNNFTCVVTDKDLFMLCVLSEVALGRLIKQNNNQAIIQQKGIANMLSSGLLFVEDWKFDIVNEHLVLVIDQFRFLCNFGLPDLSKIPYLMDNDFVQEWLAESKRKLFSREEVKLDQDSQYLPETFEPGEWNQVEAYLSSQMSPRPPKSIHKVAPEVFPFAASPLMRATGELGSLSAKNFAGDRRSSIDEGPEWQVPPEQWEIIVEQFSGAGMLSSTTIPATPNKTQGTPTQLFPKSTPTKQTPPGTPTAYLREQQQVHQISSPFGHRKEEKTRSPSKSVASGQFSQNYSSPLRNSQFQGTNKAIFESEWTGKTPPGNKLQFIAEPESPTKLRSSPMRLKIEPVETAAGFKEQENVVMEALFEGLAPTQPTQPKQQSQPLDVLEKGSSQVPFVKSTSPLKSSQLMYREGRPEMLEQEAVKSSPIVRKNSPLVEKSSFTGTRMQKPKGWICSKKDYPVPQRAHMTRR